MYDRKQMEELKSGIRKRERPKQGRQIIKQKEALLGNVNRSNIHWLIVSQCHTELISGDCVCGGAGRRGIRTSAVVRTWDHAPMLETLQKSHIVKPQSPRRSSPILSECSCSSTLFPSSDFICLYAHGDGVLMKLASLACALWEVLLSSVSAGSWLHGEVSANYSSFCSLKRENTCFGGLHGDVVAVGINKGIVSATKTHSCVDEHNIHGWHNKHNPLMEKFGKICLDIWGLVMNYCSLRDGCLNHAGVKHTGSGDYTDGSAWRTNTIVCHCTEFMKLSLSLIWLCV